MSKDTYEVVTEGDAREFVEGSDERVLHLPLVPMVKELWFVQAGEHFAVILLNDGDLSISLPAGDDATIQNEGEAIPMRIIGTSEVPFELEEVEEAIAAEKF